MENSWVIRTLKQAMNVSQVVAVYSNASEPERCSVGQIENLSDEQFIMRHVSPEGYYDGYIVRNTFNVFRIDINGQYEKRLWLLYNLQNQTHPKFITKGTINESNLFMETLLYAQEQKLIVTVFFDEGEDAEYVTGFIKAVDFSETIVRRISLDGYDDGETVFSTGDVVKISCDSTDERLLNLLYLSRNKEI